MHHVKGFSSVGLGIIITVILFVVLVLAIHFTPAKVQQQIAILGGDNMYQMRGDSMSPTIVDAGIWRIEGLLLGKPLQRGDIVEFQASVLSDNTQTAHVFQVKRVIGMPGERISIHNGEVYINSSPLDESHYLGIDVATHGGDAIAEGQDYTIPAGRYALLGDNRQFSYDSRAYGFIPEDSILARLASCIGGCGAAKQ